jgi:hypothetical protein
VADIAWQDVLDIAPELAVGVPTAFQLSVVSMANRRVSPNHFGGLNAADYKIARALFAAHFALLVKLGSLGRGVNTSVSEGGVSLSYANVQNPADPLLGSTTFGRQYQTLARLSPRSVGLVLGRVGR